VLQIPCYMLQIYCCRTKLALQIDVSRNFLHAQRTFVNIYQILYLYYKYYVVQKIQPNVDSMIWIPLRSSVHRIRLRFGHRSSALCMVLVLYYGYCTIRFDYIQFNASVIRHQKGQRSQNISFSRRSPDPKTRTISQKTSSSRSRTTEDLPLLIP
jgi:hypothetical protein